MTRAFSAANYFFLNEKELDNLIGHPTTLKRKTVKLCDYSKNPNLNTVFIIKKKDCHEFISTFKRFCNKEYGENIWQARSNDHIIRNEHDYKNIYEYIETNVIRWDKDCFYPQK